MRKNSRMMRLYLKRAAAAAVAAALTVTLACTAPSGRAFAEENAAVKSGAAGESQPGLENKEKKAEKDQKNSKEESVYVIADASGAAKKIIVSDWLKNPEARKSIEDVSDLDGIENIKGDEVFTAGKDHALTWNAEGKDIYYQGTTERELPVTVKIIYELDGK